MAKKKASKVQITEIHGMHNGEKKIFKATPQLSDTVAGATNILPGASESDQEPCSTPGQTRCKNGVLQMCFPLYSGGPCFWFTSDPPSAC